VNADESVEYRPANESEFRPSKCEAYSLASDPALSETSHDPRRKEAA
jgi:hypothetical protein